MLRTGPAEPVGETERVIGAVGGWDWDPSLGSD